MKKNGESSLELHQVPFILKNSKKSIWITWKLKTALMLERIGNLQLKPFVIPKNPWKRVGLKLLLKIELSVIINSLTFSSDLIPLSEYHIRNTTIWNNSSTFFLKFWTMILRKSERLLSMEEFQIFSLTNIQLEN